MTSLHKIACEPLERRRLYSSVRLSNHILEVIGAGSSSTITVGLTPDQQSVVASVNFQTGKGPQQVTNTFAVADIGRVIIRGGPRADLITIDQTNGSFKITTFIIAGSGNDTVFGGDEADDISGGSGDDYINTGQGINRAKGDGGNDTIIGGEGVNILLGSNGDDSLVGGAADDTLFGQGGRDTLLGNEGENMLRGGPGRDSEIGGGGNDTLYDVSGHDTMMGGGGVNTFAVRRIKADPTNDYIKGKDVLRRIAPPSDDSFWDDIFGDPLFPFA